MICDHDFPTRWSRCTKCRERKPVSPSEVDKARGCLRAWAFRYASTVPRPENKASAATGGTLHKTAEGYLANGVIEGPEWAQEMLRAALPLLPRPGTTNVERKIEQAIDGIPFQGILDMHAYAPEQIFVGDHKTSKDPKRYGVWTRADRLDDPQTLVYGTLGGNDLHDVFFRWVYYRKTQALLIAERELADDPDRYERAIRTAPRKPNVEASDCTLTAREIRGGLERVVLPIAQEIYTLREKELDPNDLPGNFDHCDAYGGCPYRSVCHRSDDAIAAGIFAGFGGSMTEQKDLFAELQMNGAPAAAPAAAAPAAFVFETAAKADPAPKAADPTAMAAPSAPALGSGIGRPPAPLEQAFPASGAAPAAPGPVYTQPLPSDAAQPSLDRGMSELCDRIGRALIAAGRVLTGEA